MECNELLGMINLEKKQCQTKPLLYSLSNYIWLIFIILIMIYFKMRKNYQKVQEIKSFGPLQNWDSSYDPHVFGYISDLHISPFFPETIRDSKTIFSIFNETGVEKILISGDICDNFASNTSIKHGQQYESDFITYKKIVDEYQSDLLIVASGNHDEFGVEKYNSPDHYILQYSDFYRKNEIYKNYENFLISKVAHEDVEIFVMNPYHYPTVRAGLGYYYNITREMIDKIENTLSKPSNSSSRILLTHFPLSYGNVWTKSSSKKTLIDIITSNNITAILAGHSHHELIIHQKASLEIHPMSIKGGEKHGGGYRYISIDNHGLSDQGFRLVNEKPVAILTYPIKKKYVSDMTDFSYHNFNQSEVRVVHFSENPNLKISVSCKNKYAKHNKIKTDFLRFQRVIRSNESLYSTPLKQLCDPENIYNNNLNEYHLTFSGDWNYSADFVVGNSVKLDKEILDTDVNMREGLIVIGIICWLIIIFIWFPITPPKYCNELNDWTSNMNCSKEKETLDFVDKTIAIIFGFLAIKSRIYYNIPSWIKTFYFILVLAPLYLPISIMKIGEKSYGAILFCGYYLKSFAFDFWGAILSSYYVIFVLLTSTIVFSAISYLHQTNKWHFVFLIDTAVAFAQIFLLKIAIFNALYQSTSFVYAFTSPFFVFSPICIFCMEIVSLSKFWLNRSPYIQNDKSSQSLTTDHLLLDYC